MARAFGQEIHDISLELKVITITRQRAIVHHVEAFEHALRVVNFPKLDMSL